MMHLTDVAIVDPGGNITAIVFDTVPSSQRMSVNNAILASNSSIEQVLFAEKGSNKIHAQMAGGEFCGNAARSLGYILADGKPSQQSFTMSGLSVSVVIESGENRAKLLMQIYPQHEKVAYRDSFVPVVHLEGISHAVLLSSDPLFAELHAQAINDKDSLRTTFTALGLSELPACGILFVEEKENSLHLSPYVYVKTINTLYAETACASGSIAVTSLLGRETHLTQPSNRILHTRISLSGTIRRAEVDGYASTLSRSQLSL